MGFAIANVVNPTTNQQNGVLAQVLNLMWAVPLSAFDGHIYMLQALFQSFNVILRRREPWYSTLIGALIHQGSNIFSIGLH